jgi:hypothetical protein
MFITRRAIAARVARLASANTTNDQSIVAASVRTEGDQATTPPMVAVTSDRPALPPATTPQMATRTADRATNDHPPEATTNNDQQATPTSTRGATYRKVRELYQGGMTVAAEIARELGVSPSYAQRTLRQVKADLARQATTARDRRTTTTGGQAISDRDQMDAARSHDHDRPETTVAGDHDQEATNRLEAAKDGDGRSTTTGDRHLVLVARDHDRGEVER